jgi:hypothetical protein
MRMGRAVYAPRGGVAGKGLLIFEKKLGLSPRGSGQPLVKHVCAAEE